MCHNPIKHIILENAVNGIPDIRAVKTRAAQVWAHMGTKRTYDQYFTLLLSTAYAYDTHHTTEAKSCDTRCITFNSDLQYHTPNLHKYDFDNNYNIDSSIS